MNNEVTQAIINVGLQKAMAGQLTDHQISAIEQALKAQVIFTCEQYARLQSLVSGNPVTWVSAF